MISKKFFASLFVLVSLTLPSFAYEKLNWKSRAITAGKASLTSNSYRVVRNLGAPNFSPELRFPLQLVYDSGANKNGLFASIWQIPQLESRAFPKGKGVEWITPWGEKIRFLQKDPKNKDILDIFKTEMKGRGCFALFQNWNATGKKGNWTISGKKDKKGWSFTYRDSRLRNISSPAGRSIKFYYQGTKLRKVMQNGALFVALNYDRSGKVVEITLNGVKHSLSYKKLPYVTLPTNIADKAKNFDRVMLTSVKRGALSPIKYSYDSYGYLNKIERGDFKDELKIDHETLKERFKYLNKLADLRKRKKSTRRLTASRTNITGRIISDSFFKYSYRQNIVTVRNLDRQKATYDYDIKKGILSITNFAGRLPRLISLNVMTLPITVKSDRCATRRIE